jgi:aryl-alcohol dehydrogenase-like predicted oxidoreductase
LSRSFQQTPSWGIPTTLGRTQRTVVVAFAWVLASGEDISPTPGTKRQSYLEESAAGERYSEGMMRLIDTQRS